MSRSEMSAKKRIAELALQAPDGRVVWKRVRRWLWRVDGTKLDQPTEYAPDAWKLLRGSALRCKLCQRHRTKVVISAYQTFPAARLGGDSMGYAFDGACVFRRSLYDEIAPALPPHSEVPFDVAEDFSADVDVVGVVFDPACFVPVVNYPQFDCRCIECRQHIQSAGPSDQLIEKVNLPATPIGITEHFTLFTADSLLAERLSSQWGIRMAKWRPVVEST